VPDDAAPAGARADRALVLATLAATLVVAAVLRFHHLDTESVWLDEAFSIATSRTSLANIVAENSQDVHPPLHYFLLHYWGFIAGTTTWAGRALSALCSLGTIAAAYLAGARLRGRATGVIAAILLAISVFQVEFAQEARMYALLALLSTLSMYFFVRLLDESSPRVFSGYAIATTAMVYTQAYAAFVLAAQATSLAWTAWRRREHAAPAATRWIVALIVVLAAFLPWLAIFTWQFSAVQHGFWITEPEWAGIFAPFFAYAGSTPGLALLASLAIVGLVRMARRPAHDSVGSPRAPLVVVLPWLLAPIALPFLLSRIGSPIFLSKYTIAASVPFAILAADGVAAMHWTVVRVLLVTAVIGLGVAPLQKYYGTVRKDNWRAAVPAVERQAQPDDLILFYPYFHQIPFDYYRQRDDLVERAFPLFTPPPPSDGWDRTIARAVGQHRRIWLVTLQGDPTRAIVVAEFERRFVERSHQKLQHIEVWLFEVPVRRAEPSGSAAAGGPEGPPLHDGQDARSD
jgi:4-amino-4-deoxy-L-arabinose transferase-like glycosyltransferase